jgi:hypothetical protein
LVWDLRLVCPGAVDFPGSAPVIAHLTERVRKALAPEVAALPGLARWQNLRGQAAGAERRAALADAQAAKVRAERSLVELELPPDAAAELVRLDGELERAEDEARAARAGRAALGRLEGELRRQLQSGLNALVDGHVRALQRELEAGHFERIEFARVAAAVAAGEHLDKAVAYADAHLKLKGRVTASLFTDLLDAVEPAPEEADDTPAAPPDGWPGGEEGGGPA